MQTNNICFYGELTKIILQLSSNTLIIYSSAPVAATTQNQVSSEKEILWQQDNTRYEIEDIWLFSVTLYHTRLYWVGHVQ